MQPFLVWCALLGSLYAGLAGAYHVYLTHYPRHVVVALDTSYPMHTVWSQVPATLATIQQRRYTQFSLITDKAKLHSWQPTLTLGALQPYAPRALVSLLDPHTYPALCTADQIYVVTNAARSRWSRTGISCSSNLSPLRAYPYNPAARKAMRAQRKW